MVESLCHGSVSLSCSKDLRFPLGLVARLRESERHLGRSRSPTDSMTTLASTSVRRKGAGKNRSLAACYVGCLQVSTLCFAFGFPGHRFLPFAIACFLQLHIPSHMKRLHLVHPTSCVGARTSCGGRHSFFIILSMV